jgi:drug/metabolite transporter (DMT)-like permease
MRVTTLTTAPSRTGLAAGAAAVTVVLWASSVVAIRHLGTEISPGALSLARLELGSIFLGGLLLTKPPSAARRWPVQRDWQAGQVTSAAGRRLKRGWLFLGGTPAILALAGGALCLIGVAISRRAA